MVRVVQGPGYRKMTIRLKDTAVCGDRVTPKMATYGSLFLWPANFFTGRTVSTGC